MNPEKGVERGMVPNAAFLGRSWNPEKGVESPNWYRNREPAKLNPEKGVESWNEGQWLSGDGQYLNPEKGVESFMTSLKPSPTIFGNPEKGVESLILCKGLHERL